MNYLMDYHIHSIYSSDGHNTITELCKSAVSKGLEEAAELASTAGFRFITAFSNREPEWVRITEEKNIFSIDKQIITR